MIVDMVTTALVHIVSAIVCVAVRNSDRDTESISCVDIQSPQFPVVSVVLQTAIIMLIVVVTMMILVWILILRWTYIYIVVLMRILASGWVHEALWRRRSLRWPVLVAISISLGDKHSVFANCFTAIDGFCGSADAGGEIR